MSSKFSRPVPVQQPPPICKKSVPVMGAKFPLAAQTITVAFSIHLFHRFDPSLTKDDGAVINLGKSDGSLFNPHWETSPFNDPSPDAWRVDLKWSKFTNRMTGIFWWVEVHSTIWQFSCTGIIDPLMPIWQWKPTPQPFVGIRGGGTLLFATTNK